MERIKKHSERLSSLRDNVQRIIGKKDSLVENIFKSKQIEENIVENLTRISKAKILLEMFVKGTEVQVREYIEPTVTEALHFIFNQSLFFHIVFVERRGQIEVDFIVIGGQEKENEYQEYLKDLEKNRKQFDEFVSEYTDITYLYGGAITEILGLILRLLLVEFLQIKGPIFLDEPTSAVHETYASRVGVFIKSLSEKFDRQIIFVTHSSALASSANKVYEVRKEGVLSIVEEL